MMEQFVGLRDKSGGIGDMVGGRTKVMLPRGCCMFLPAGGVSRESWGVLQPFITFFLPRILVLCGNARAALSAR